ncbi:ABC transporter permease [Lacticaseibacillus zhaodongensis]|uniref:ABC transporter permease n=1 Tax=Lacticaseibacillus zhaodongensis TaxID=2668065 RepID=UPI0012D34E67|nr:ABC-2 family transporter protein [Lacticaseibacillus zhaodongensis]
MKYLLIGVNSFSSRLAYRSNEITKLATNIARMLVSIWMWRFLYNNQSSIGGYSIENMTKYLIITNLAAIIFSTSPIFRLSSQIRTGALNNLLYRPISIFGEGLATFLGGQIIYIIVLLVFLVAQLISKSPFQMLLLVVYMLACVMMFFTFMMLLGSLSFWLINVWPLRSAVNAAYLLLGGLYFPLSFLGSKYTFLLSLNPFSLVSDVPARLLLGQSGESITTYLAVVVGWIIVFILLYRVVIRKGIARFEGVGV